MKKIIVLLSVLFWMLLDAGATAEPQQFVLEPIGTSTLFEPTGTTTSMVWSLKLGAPEESEQAIASGQEVGATVLTPIGNGRWIRSIYRAFGKQNQVRLELVVGGPELLPESLRSINPALVSEVAVYPTGIRVNFRYGVTAAQVRAGGLPVQ